PRSRPSSCGLAERTTRTAPPWISSHRLAAGKAGCVAVTDSTATSMARRFIIMLSYAFPDATRQRTKRWPGSYSRDGASRPAHSGAIGLSGPVETRYRNRMDLLRRRKQAVISGYLDDQFLIAMPGMRDDRF